MTDDRDYEVGSLLPDRWYIILKRKDDVLNAISDMNLSEKRPNRVV